MNFEGIGSTITGALNNLDTSIYTFYPVPGQTLAASLNSVDIYGNTTFWLFRSNLVIKTGNLTCSLYYDDNYYVRLQNYRVSELVHIFPNISSAPLGAMIKSTDTVVQNTDTSRIYPSWVGLVKETATEVRLISSTLSQPTSGTLNNTLNLNYRLRTSGLLSSKY